MFKCKLCLQPHAKWVGKCTNCAEWNTIEETNEIKIAGKTFVSNLEFVQFDKTVEPLKRIATCISEFDRTIGGGLVPGGVILLSGDPGIGKSTLVLQIANSDLNNKSALYISGEESVSQIHLRAKRLNIEHSKMKLASSNNLEEIIDSIYKHKKEIGLIIIDSIQTISSSTIDSPTGSVSQMKHCSQALIDIAKKESMPLIMIGHVTKEGAIAGPKLLEHSVDVVLYFEGEKNYSFRILRPIKNRFGSTEEIGIFEICDIGLRQIENPSLMFLNNQKEGACGSIIFPSVEGNRVLMLEIQALVSNSFLQMPRRAVIGWNQNRLPMICAVLEKHCKITLSNKDVYLNVMGGFNVNEPAADLAVLIAMVSSITNISIPTNYVAFGEIALSGEIRLVQHMEKRIQESKKLLCGGIFTSKLLKSTKFGKRDVKQVGQFNTNLDANLDVDFDANFNLDKNDKNSDKNSDKNRDAKIILLEDILECVTWIKKSKKNNDSQSNAQSNAQLE